MGEVINSVVTDKRMLIDPRSSQGLLAGIVSAIRQRPTETDAVVLMELAPMVEQMFIKYEWVEAADGLMKSGLWAEGRKAELEEVLKGFEEGADEDLRERINKSRASHYFVTLHYLIANGEIEQSFSLLSQVGNIISSEALVNKPLENIAKYNHIRKSFNAGLIDIEDYYRQRLSFIDEVLNLSEQFIPDMLTSDLSADVVPSAKKQDLQTLLTNAEISLCIKSLLNIKEIDKKHLLLISARFELMEKDNRYGIIDSKFYDRHRNVINKALFDFIEEEYKSGRGKII
jgi:hypothetical protein